MHFLNTSTLNTFIVNAFTIHMLCMRLSYDINRLRTFSLCFIFAYAFIYCVRIRNLYRLFAFILLNCIIEGF